MDDEVARLLRLVDDLQQVAMLDAGGPRLERRPMALSALVSDAVGRAASSQSPQPRGSPCSRRRPPICPT
jgi:signal transduction histidine kinase